MDFSIYDVKLDISASVMDEKARIKASAEMTASELRQHMKSAKLKEKELRELAIELHKKIAIPTSCFVFALLAVPLGIRKHRTARSRGFVLGLITVLAYYILRLIGEALGETGRIPVPLGAWLPNVLFGIAGVYLFTMAVREKPLWPFRAVRKDF